MAATPEAAMPDDAPSRFHAISTVRELLGDPDALFERYGRAVRAYLFAILDDEDGVQDVLLRLRVKALEGRFAKWEPGRGRFRFYLKQAVRNEALQHARAARKRRLETQLEADPADASAGPADDPWLGVYRAAVLDAALHALKVYQAENRAAGNVFHTLVGLLTAHPGAADDELAGLLAAAAGRPVTVANLAQQKRRARRKLAEFIAAEVRLTLDDPTPEAVADELATLGLTAYVADFLDDPAG